VESFLFEIKPNDLLALALAATVLFRAGVRQAIALHGAFARGPVDGIAE
jgi:hypothetical protein